MNSNISNGWLTGIDNSNSDMFHISQSGGVVYGSPGLRFSKEQILSLPLQKCKSVDTFLLGFPLYTVKINAGDVISVYDAGFTWIYLHGDTFVEIESHYVQACDSSEEETIIEAITDNNDSRLNISTNGDVIVGEWKLQAYKPKLNLTPGTKAEITIEADGSLCISYGQRYQSGVKQITQTDLDNTVDPRSYIAGEIMRALGI